jgi:hypothetical protein
MAQVALLALTACGGSGEATDQGTGAATAEETLKILAGAYENGLQVAVHNGTVSGAFASSVGDVSHGGATCTFTFSGRIATTNGQEHANITAVDGFDSATGTIIASTEGAVKITLDHLPNACARVSPVLADKNGLELGRHGDLPKEILGFRTVKADKAFFHAAATPAHQASFVLRGDTVATVADEASGFVQAEFIGPKVTTKGFIQSSDLVPVDSRSAPAPGTDVSGKFVLHEDDGGGTLTITSATADKFSFNLGFNAPGTGNIGDIEGGTAERSGSSARFTGDFNCAITFVFDDAGSSVTLGQETDCGFGANVDVSGTYTKQ